MRRFAVPLGALLLAGALAAPTAASWVGADSAPGVSVRAGSMALTGGAGAWDDAAPAREGQQSTWRQDLHLALVGDNLQARLEVTTGAPDDATSGTWRVVDSSGAQLIAPTPLGSRAHSPALGSSRSAVLEVTATTTKDGADLTLPQATVTARQVRADTPAGWSAQVGARPTPVAAGVSSLTFKRAGWQTTSTIPFGSLTDSAAVLEDSRREANTGVAIPFQVTALATGAADLTYRFDPADIDAWQDALPASNPLGDTRIRLFPASPAQCSADNPAATNTAEQAGAGLAQQEPQSQDWCLVAFLDDDGARTATYDITAAATITDDLGNSAPASGSTYVTYQVPSPYTPQESPMTTAAKWTSRNASGAVIARG